MSGSAPGSRDLAGNKAGRWPFRTRLHSSGEVGGRYSKEVSRGCAEREGHTPQGATLTLRGDTRQDNLKRITFQVPN